MLKKFSPTFVGPVCSAVLAARAQPAGGVVGARARPPRSAIVSDDLGMEAFDWLEPRIEERTAMFVALQDYTFRMHRG